MNEKRPHLAALALSALVVSGVIASHLVGGGSSSPEGQSAGAEQRSSRRASDQERPRFRPGPQHAKPEEATDIESPRASALDDWERACQEAIIKGSEAVASLVAAWVGQDSDAAIRWVLSLEGELRETGLATLAVELASKDPQYALELAFAMEQDVARNETSAFVMTQWAARNPAAILQWTRELDDAGLRMAAEQRLLPAIASQDPVMAATYAAEHTDQPGLQMAVVPAILQRWAQQDPESAAAWAESIPDPTLRTQGLDAMLRVWAHQDPGQLRAWWSNAPHGTFRNEAAAAMVEILAETDRPAALLYAEAITDDALRASALGKIAAP